MICNTCNLTSRNKKIKMSNQKIYIPSGSIGEIKYDDQENNWFQTSSAEFYEQNQFIKKQFEKLITLNGKYFGDD